LAFNRRNRPEQYDFSVGLATLFNRLDRWAGKFNRWFGSAAVAASAQRSGEGGKAQKMDSNAALTMMVMTEDGEHSPTKW